MKAAYGLCLILSVLICGCSNNSKNNEPTKSNAGNKEIETLNKPALVGKWDLIGKASRYEIQYLEFFDDGVVTVAQMRDGYSEADLVDATYVILPDTRVRITVTRWGSMFLGVVKDGTLTISLRKFHKIAPKIK